MRDTPITEKDYLREIVNATGEDEEDEETRQRREEEEGPQQEEAVDQPDLTMARQCWLSPNTDVPAENEEGEESSLLEMVKILEAITLSRMRLARYLIEKDADEFSDGENAELRNIEEVLQNDDGSDIPALHLSESLPPPPRA